MIKLCYPVVIRLHNTTLDKWKPYKYSYCEHAKYLMIELSFTKSFILLIYQNSNEKCSDDDIQMKEKILFCQIEIDFFFSAS